MRGARLFLRAAIALAAVAPVVVPAEARAPKTPSREDTLKALHEFQQRDARLQNVGWRLVRANAEFCDTVVASIGLQLLDTAGYGGPDIVRDALGLEGAFAVQHAAKGSPAAASGAFTPNREVTRFAGFDPNAWPAQNRLDWRRLKPQDTLDAHLERSGAITVTFTDGAHARVEPVSTCASRFEVLADSRNAFAEGSRVIIGADFPGFEWEEDEVFAGVVAHELAHNLLHHRAWLDTTKRKRRDIRLTEREADRLAPWLLANAGYDPAAAHRFMMRWGKRHDPGIFRKRTHDGWDERADFIAAELPIIAELMAREGKADWSVHFRREITPEPAEQMARNEQAAPTTHPHSD